MSPDETPPMPAVPPRSADPSSSEAAGDVPSSVAGAELARLVEVMRRLRGPDGCPWDREQTARTLAPFVLEEAHEVVDAIEQDDVATLRGEIGDLVFEGVFLAQLYAEQGAFTIADSIRDVTEKLIRRHPHVFLPEREKAGSAAAHVRSAGQVVEQWEQIKARERAAQRTSRAGALDGIARSLPALLTAYEMGARAAAVGFDWDAAADVLAKIEEEIGELRSAVTSEPPGRAAEEMGDLLFAVANLSRKLGVEPETALRAANRKFMTRFRALEEEIERRGRHAADLTLDELDAVWQQVKRAERGAPGGIGGLGDGGPG